MNRTTRLATGAIAAALAAALPSAQAAPPPARAAQAGPTLGARWVQNDKRKLTVDWGAGASIIGRVRDPTGAPIPGAIVQITTLPRGDQQPTLTATLTNAYGVWRQRIKGRTRSQSLVVTHTAADGTPLASQTLGLSVRARITLRVRRTSGGLRFSGRLHGRKSAHRILELQARIPGTHRWQTVRTLRTRSHGRYVARRRFHGARYTFRVRYQPQQGFGYRANTSPARTIRVR